MKENLQDKLASIISYVFHPLLMPTIGILIILNSGTHFSFLPIEIKRLVFYSILMMSCVLPLLFMPVFKLQGIISSYKMDDKKERLLPLFIITLIYFTGFYFISRFSFIPRFIKIYVLTIAIASFIGLLVTMKIKVSLHMLGIGGITGLLITLLKFQALHLDIYFISAFAVGGFVGASRLKLNNHSPLQVYLGLIIGFLAVIIPFTFN
ncbi:hypothetical protein ACFLTE_02700 [Bacteroidota bacterium]